MSEEQPAREKSDGRTPATKTDVPHRIRQKSVSLMDTEDFVCIDPLTPLRVAIERMKEDEGGCAIICERERIVGIFTERDLLNRVVGEEIDLDSPVGEWMSPIVETLTPEATIGDAVLIMNEKGYRNIPLVRDDRLIGSISVFDVLTFLAESYPKETMNLPPVPAQVMDTQEGG